MGKGKLEKFADMASYPHVFEYPYSVADNVAFGMKSFSAMTVRLCLNWAVVGESIP